MTNRGNQIHLSCPLVPVMKLRVISEIRSLILITNLESFFDSNPYFVLIEDLPSKSRNCFLFFRKSSCPASAPRFLWLRLPGFVRLRDLSGGWWFLSLLDRILSHKPPWNSPDLLPRHQSRWYSKRTLILGGEEKSNLDYPQSESLANGGVGEGAGMSRDLSRGEDFVDRSLGQDLRPISRRSGISGATGTIPTVTQRRTRKTATPKPEKAQWKRFVRTVAKQIGAFFIIVGLFQLTRKMFLMASFPSSPISSFETEMAFSGLEGRIAEVGGFVKTTMNTMQFQFELLDKMMERKAKAVRPAIRLWLDILVFVPLQSLYRCYAHTNEFQVQFVCDCIVCVVELWLHQSGFSGIAMSRLHVGLAMYRWDLLDTSESEPWDGLAEEIYRDEVFHNDIGTEVLVPLYLHFRISFEHIGFHATFCEKRFSHKLLHTNRNKEKSNMKLDNNGSSGRLASKATLRKASSNSLLLYFLLVYGAYSCVCNNCVSIILLVFVITLLD